MPQKVQTISVAGYDANLLQAIAYGSFQKLNRNVKYAGDIILIGYTPKAWNRYEDEIIIKTTDNQLTITSKLVHGESFDMMGKNKKHIADFMAAFEEVKKNAGEMNINEWKEKIIPLKEETLKIAEVETKQAEEVNKVMNLAKGNMYVTYGIIGINVLVFIAMVATGVNAFEPTSLDIIKWGANYLHLTASGEWWRLLTCVFVHIGIIHLVFNMYALFMIGTYLEPMLGKTRFIIAYLCTGIFASLASLWWHDSPVPSAGASGAIFGMYGVFLALLSTSLIPSQTRKALLQSIGVFVVYNLLYGMKAGVDNAAHIGGLLSGAVIGYLYYLTIKNTDNKRKMMVEGIVVAATVVVSFMYLETAKKRVDPAEKELVTNMVKRGNYKDEEKFVKKYNEFIDIQDKAIAPLQDTSLSEAEKQAKIKEITMPEWEKAEQLVKELKTYNLSDESKRKIEIMDEYIQLRKQEAGIVERLITTKNADDYTELNAVREKIDSTVASLSQ
jgi:rhomboid protease GluP